MTVSKAKRAAIGGAMGFGLVAMMLNPSQAAAANNNDYQLSAEANSVRVTVIDPGAPLIQQYDASPYGSSATLTSLGTSAADAGAPYSPVAAALTGTLSGLGGATGELPPIPPFPGYVHSSYPIRAKDVQKQAGYTISAISAADRSEGAVALGASASTDASTMSSTAKVQALDDGGVIATASAGVDLLNLGGILDLGNVTSSATLTKRAGAASTYTTSTNLGTVTLAGLKLDLLGIATKQNLTPTLIQTLNTVLAPSGIKLAYLPAMFVYADGSTSLTPDRRKVIQAVDSAALQVEMTQKVPSQGDVVVRLTLGRVYLTATDDPGVSIPAFPSDGGTAIGSGSGVQTPQAVTPPSIPAGDTAPPTDVSGGSDAAPITIGGDSPIVAGDSAPTSDGGAAPQALAARLQLGPSGQSVYLALVAAALVVLGAGQLTRLLGVRLAFGAWRRRP